MHTENRARSASVMMMTCNITIFCDRSGYYLFEMYGRKYDG